VRHQTQNIGRVVRVERERNNVHTVANAMITRGTKRPWIAMAKRTQETRVSACPAKPVAARGGKRVGVTSPMARVAVAERNRQGNGKRSNKTRNQKTNEMNKADR